MKRITLFLVLVCTIAQHLWADISVQTRVFDSDSQPPIVGGVIHNFVDNAIVMTGVLMSVNDDDLVVNMQSPFSTPYDKYDNPLAPTNYRIVDCSNTGKEQFWCPLTALESGREYYIKAYAIKTDGSIIYGQTESLHSQTFSRYSGPTGIANVFYAFSYTLFDLVTDEIIDPNDGFYYSTNENPRTVRHAVGTSYNTCYKFATEWNYKLWYYHSDHCDSQKIVHCPIMSYKDGMLTIAENPLDENKNITLYYSINGNFFRPETYTNVYTTPIEITESCYVCCYAVSSDGFISYTNLFVVDNDVIPDTDNNGTYTYYNIIQKDLDPNSYIITTTDRYIIQVGEGSDNALCDDNGHLSGASISTTSEDISQFVWHFEESDTEGEYYMCTETGMYVTFTGRSTSYGTLSKNKSDACKIKIDKAYTPDLPTSYWGIQEQQSGKKYGLNNLYCYNTRFNWWTHEDIFTYPMSDAIGLYRLKKVTTPITYTYYNIIQEDLDPNNYNITATDRYVIQVGVGSDNALCDDNGHLSGASISTTSEDISQFVWHFEESDTEGEYYMCTETGMYVTFTGRSTSYGTLSQNKSDACKIKIDKAYTPDLPTSYWGIQEQQSGKKYGLNNLYCYNTRFNWWTHEDIFTESMGDTFSLYRLKKVSLHAQNIPAEIAPNSYNSIDQVKDGKYIINRHLVIKKGNRIYSANGEIIK